MILIAIFLILLTFFFWIPWSTKVYKKDPAAVNIFFTALMMTIIHVCLLMLFVGIIIANLSSLYLIVVHISSLIILWLLNGRGQIKSSMALIQSSFIDLTKLITTSLTNKIIFTILVLINGVSLLKIAFFSTSVFDSLVYHLPISINWYQKNRTIFFDDVAVHRINYSAKVTKLLNSYILQITGSLDWIELTQYFAPALLLLGCWAILRSAAVNTRLRYIAIAIIASMPLTIIENVTLQDHIFLVAAHIGLIKIIIDLLEDRVDYKTGGALFFMAIAVLLGSKFSAPAHVIVIIGTFFLFYPKETFRIIQKLSLKWIVSGLFVCFSIGLIWYLSNIIHYGSLFGERQAQATFDMKLIRNLLDLPVRIMDFKHRWTPDLIEISGFGPFIFALGIPMMIYSFTRQQYQKIIRALLASSFILLIIYFQLYYTSYNYRLFQFLPVILVMISFIGISSLTHRFQKIIILLAVGSMTFNFFTTLFPEYLDNIGRRYRVAIASEPDERTSVRLNYASQQFSRDPSFIFLDQYL